MPAMSPPDTVSLNIGGMTCASCVGRVEKALLSVSGVQSATVNLVTEKASITGATDPGDLIAAVERVGYDARLTPRRNVPPELVQPTDRTSGDEASGVGRVELAIDGMSCASCVGRVEKALLAVPGTVGASINLATERASVQGNVSPADLIAAVARSGYSARVMRQGSATIPPAPGASRQEARLGRDLIWAALLSLPLFIVEMGGHLIPAIHHLILATIGAQTSWVLQAALTSLVLAGPGRRFFVKGIPALLRGGPDMNSLVAIGTAAAWFYSMVATFAPGLLPPDARHVYFEAAASITVLILLGRLFEARAKGRASQAINRLIQLQPQTARVLRGTQLVDLPVADVATGDLIDMRPGERVPVDGLVSEGDSWLDEAMLTGEAMPVAKGPGARVTGGTLNQTGAFRYVATEVGEAAMLSRIIRMVEEAQGGKLPIQALVDRVTGWFVPAILGVAALTFGAWLVLGPAPALGPALVSAVAVLVIACPCAMGLATPTSILVASGRAAELGILFRKGEALQRLSTVRIIAFDKTGTLTMGKPVLTDLVTVPGFDRALVLGLVAAVEARSEHPIARALVAASVAEGLDPRTATQVVALPGFGITGHVDGHQVAVGADRHMRQIGLDPGAFGEQATRLAALGRTPLYAAIDGQLAAVLAVADPVKPTTAAALGALRALGLKLAMVTGDNRATALAIAHQLGIDQVVAEVLPDGKVEAIRRLAADHGLLAFAGDGINDAPALAAAHVGIAMGTGTDVSIEAADVVLIAGNLMGVSAALALSRATMANIRQNLFWAFAYNALLIPVAAGALYPSLGLLLSPVMAAAAMALSSLFVLGNALRLRRFQPLRG